LLNEFIEIASFDVGEINELNRFKLKFGPPISFIEAAVSEKLVLPLFILLLFLKPIISRSMFISFYLLEGILFADSGDLSINENLALS